MTVAALAIGLATSAPVFAKKHPVDTEPAITAIGRKAVDKYPTVEMHKSKRGDDESAGVVYLNAEQREQRRIVVRDGLVYDHTGRPISETTGKHGGKNNYVMDAAGNFYLFDEFTTKTIRHSSIFAGGPVAGAGNIQIRGGHIVYIDTDSGHYPSKKVFENELKELASCGVYTASF
jgi:hypothetical protein